MTLSSRRKSKTPGRLAALVLIGCAGAALYYGRLHRSATANPALSDSRPAPEMPSIGAQGHSQIAGDVGVGGATPPMPLGTPSSLTAATGPRAVSVVMKGPLETALGEAAGKAVAPALAQVVTRVLVWWVPVPGGLRTGDRLDILFEERPSEEPMVYAVRFTSTKLGKSFSVYRFQPEGEHYARYFSPEGDDLERRLVSSPLEHYEQVTSLIRDGRRHKGVDFRTPVGTPVRATFAGTITRRNWNWRGNGNSIELTEAAAPHRHAIFLHMSELPKSLQVGQRIERGALVGSSGNSGHSFAPHLHYQLMSDNDQVLDPFDGPTQQDHLPLSQKPALAAAVARWESLMAPPAVAGN